MFREVRPPGRGGERRLIDWKGHSRRTTSTAAHLIHHVLPPVPIRQRVLTLPPRVRFLIVYRPELIDLCLARYARTVFEWIVERTGASLPSP